MHFFAGKFNIVLKRHRKVLPQERSEAKGSSLRGTYLIFLDAKIGRKKKIASGGYCFTLFNIVMGFTQKEF
jgi:hypothetical protein